MKVSEDVLVVLDAAETNGHALTLVGQLDRKMYAAVNKVLEAAGGKWNRQAKAHLFAGEAADAVDQVILTGEISTHQELGWFPTPKPIVDIVIGQAELEPGMRVLEPSAGLGALALPAIEAGCIVTMVEIDMGRVLALDGQGLEVVREDFLLMEQNPWYDRVIMNPPFARQADIDHVTHALGFLKPGGRLVSVMSNGVVFRQNRKTVEFRALEPRYVPLPSGAFRTSGTAIETVIVVIDR